MRYWILLNALDLFRSNAKVRSIFRIDEDRIVIDLFDERVLLDLTPSKSLIVFLDDSFLPSSLATPFDVVLAKRIARAKLAGVKLLGNDKILVLEFSKIASFKEEKSYLIVELTGRYTNAIITDEDFVIVESIKKISNSIRKIASKESYKAPIPPKNQPDLIRSNNIRSYLLDLYAARSLEQLDEQKSKCIKEIDQKIAKYRDLMASLPTIESLEKEAKVRSLEAELILNNLNKIKSYAKSVEMVDYDGNVVLVDLDGYKTPQMAANGKYAKAKRLKAKIKNAHLEIENLQSRIDFYARVKDLIAGAKTIEDLRNKIPQKPTKIKEKKRNEPIDYFVIGGYKVGVGRNERGNSALLKQAKASDLWLHMKDYPSAHIVIRVVKGTPPMEVIEEAGRLCVVLSGFKSGQYLVDYTPRRFVRIQEGASVLYNSYKTIVAKV